MFGNLFEEGEDFDFVSENKGINGRKSRKKEHEPPAPRAACNLSGIKNQGGTCYLNSLLQTLLYTPEFRESLFALGPEELGCLPDKDKPKSKVRVIPLELQRLFAQLLLADQLAASTTDLTDSFGWTGNEQTSQHDVQELNRILFSALECSLVGTSGHDLINRLYHGIVVNKIVCKECDNVSERQDIIYNRQEDFLDLTLTVKGVSGLEEALCNFYVEEEQFDNDNLYRCGRCEKLVKATKSAKLRHLPTFLTISLLRFNYDFVKSERYKETGCYTFPVRLAMQPFCEQGDLDDVEFEYELFSVIIHKGGCYGGHYHAYIKDIDQLGTWFSPDEENVVVDLTKDTTSKQGHKTSNVLDLGDPLETLRTILVQVGSDGLLVDQLGQKLLEKVGFAWNKRYRKQHGPLKKFLENHPAVFLLKANGTRVSVKQPANCCLEQQPNKSKAKKTPSGSGSAQLCNHDIHWFNFDDSQVQPIHEKDVEKQFQGKESAYMLFYRKSRLQRTAAAKGNPKFKVPLHLQEEMANDNTELQKQRMEFDSAVNNIEVHLHLGPEYKFVNGALHPASSQKDSVLTLTIDKRKTIGDLRQSAFQLLEFWEGDMVIHVAKQLPAGLHLYERFDGKPEFVEGVLSIITLFWPKQLAVGRTEDQASLCSLEITDGAILFLWNGNQVHGVEVEAGQEVEPVLLQILLSTLRSKLDSGEVEFKELRQAFPRRMTLGALQETVVLSMGIPPEDLTICHRKTLKNKASSDWSAYASEDFHKTLEELSLKDNDSLLILDQKYSDPSVLSSNGMPVTVATLCDHSWVQIKNYRDEKMMQVEGTTVTIPVTMEMLVSEVKLYAIEKLKLKANLANDSCLRPIDQTGKLLPPVREDLTLRDTGLKTGSTLALCCGSAPTDNQLFLNFAVGDSANLSPEMGVIVEQKISVRECLKLMLEKAALPGEWWHLRKTDWCYEAGEVLKDEEASLADLKISTGETLLIMEGRLPPKGFLKLPVWLYQSTLDSKNRKYLEDEQGSFTHKLSALNISAARDNSLQHHLDTELVFMGDIEISGEANLEDLKTQVQTLPTVQSLSVPSVKFLRVWLLESKCRTKILRNHQQQLSKFKLGSSVEIGIQLLQADEELTSTELLLQLRMAVPGERSYYTPEDFIFDTSKECTVRTLRHKISQVYSLTMEQIEIAKYFPEKSTWMPISSWSQQVSKKKRKKKPENLQGAPYHLKDGDIIGVKNLLIDKDKEFSTLTDDVVKQQHRLEGSKGDRSCQAPAHQSADGLNGKTARARRPEVALSISVADFR